MKPLVTDYHTLNITDLARGRWLSPYSKYEWVWRFQNGTRTLSVPITVLTDSLQLLYPMGTHRVLHEMQLTHSRGPHGGRRL